MSGLFTAANVDDGFSILLWDRFAPIQSLWITADRDPRLAGEINIDDDA